MKKWHGFTLIELMIVVTIIGILLAIAFPSYTNYVLKSHRSDATASLLQGQAIIERCYAQNFSYSAACAALPAYPRNSGEGYYSITLTNLTASTYTLTATAIGNQTKDTNCITFSVDQANQRTALDNGGNTQTSCWRS